MICKLFDKVPIGTKVEYDLTHSGAWTYQIYNGSSFEDEIKLGYRLIINLNNFSNDLNETYLEALSCKQDFVGTIIIPYQMVNKQYLYGLVAINGFYNEKWK